MAGTNTHTLTWDDIPSVGPADIQSGRIVYIDVERLSESVTVTKASAGKILQFIHEGFLPVFRDVDGGIAYTPLIAFLLNSLSDSSVKRYTLVTPLETNTLYAYSDALDKPFSTLLREDYSTQ